MTTCERIDALLAEKNMSRRQLAISAGIPPSSFQSAMQRNTTISLDMLFSISDVLGVSVEYLKNGETANDEIPQQELDRMAEEYLLSIYGAPENAANLNDSIPFWSHDLSRKENLIFNTLAAHYKRLNLRGMEEATKRIEQMTRLAEYKRIEQAETPTEPLAEDEQGKSSTEQEKSPEGQTSPNDGK